MAFWSWISDFVKISGVQNGKNESTAEKVCFNI